ncbi:MAG: M20/M25/M40 family metallo-hydrolase [Actinomycetota bacterium]
MRIELLRALAEVAGPSGREDRVRAIVRPELEATCDDVAEDAVGNLLGRRAGSGGPRVMLAAHMDEIGLMVTHVDDRGYLRVIPLGGWDARTLVGQRVLVRGRRDLPGVVGTRPVHLLTEAERAKAPTIEDLAVDVGLTADEARSLVRAGDTITRVRDLVEMGSLLTGKSIDDRVGVFVMLEAMAAAARGPAEVHAVASAQEEVGLRGARVAAHRVRPEIGVAIDTCPSDDGPGAPSDTGGARIGAGAAIRVADASAIASQPLLELLRSLADERGIPWQTHVSARGGTDTQAIQLAADGCHAACISIPTRYVHSSVEACHPDDVEACIALTAALVEEAHRLEA